MRALEFSIQGDRSIAEPRREKRKEEEKSERAQRRGREMIFRSYRQLGYEVARFIAAQFSTRADKIRAGTHGHLSPQVESAQIFVAGESGVNPWSQSRFRSRSDWNAGNANVFDRAAKFLRSTEEDSLDFYAFLQQWWACYKLPMLHRFLKRGTTFLFLVFLPNKLTSSIPLMSSFEKNDYCVDNCFLSRTAKREEARTFTFVRHPASARVIWRNDASSQ